MQVNAVRLSVEELALALTHLGKLELGRDLMVAQLGEMSQEEARTRLLSAGHSLMARGSLEIDKGGGFSFADSVVRVVSVLVRADFSIRYSRSYPDAEINLSYHFGEGSIFEHKVEQGVVHCITEVQDTDIVIRGGLIFFEVDQAHSFACPQIEIPNSLLDEIKDEENVPAILHRLQELGVPENARALLAEDLHDSQYRGSALRVEYGEDNVPRSDHGLLLLRGPERLWLVRPYVREDMAFVTIFPGTIQSFRRELSALLRSAS